VSYVTVTLTTTIYETATASPRPDSEACTSLAISCVADDLALKPGGLFATVFDKLSCVMAFPCRAVTKSQTPDALIAEMFGDLARYPPTSYTEPRLSKNVRSCTTYMSSEMLTGAQIFAQHSTDNVTWSQEDFVNTYYGKLNETYYGELPPQFVHLALLSRQIQLTRAADRTSSITGTTS
jgi:hypothetical protein